MANGYHAQAVIASVKEMATLQRIIQGNRMRVKNIPTNNILKI